jgi:hypothetical protein
MTKKQSFGPNPYYIFTLLDQNGMVLQKTQCLGVFELKFDEGDDGYLKAEPIEPSAAKTALSIWEAKFAGITQFGVELNGYEALDKDCATFRRVSWLLVQALPASDLIARIDAANIRRVKEGGFKGFGLDMNQS